MEKMIRARDAYMLVLKQLLTFIIIAAVAELSVLLITKYAFGIADSTVTSIITSAVYSIGALIVFLKKKWCILSPTFIQGKPWGLLAWSLLLGAGAFIPEAFLSDIMPKLPNVIDKEMKDLISNEYGYLTLCLFAPLVEEAVFRGAILRTLLRSMNSRWGAIAISALIFSIIHMNPAQMPFAFLGGLLLGWLYCRTGSIVPGVVYHWTNNTLVFATYRILPPQLADGDLIDIFGGNQRTMALAVIFSLFIFLPSLYQLNLRTKH